jgi:hypothetical protein
MVRTMKDETSYPGLLVLAAGLSLAAGVVHFTVVPEHLSEWWGYGFFFTIVALAQLTYGLLLFIRPWAYAEDGGFRSQPAAYTRRIYLAGAIGNLAVICLYLITRTVGIPFFGPGAGEVEPVTALDAAVTLTESVLLGVLLALARQEAARVPQPVKQ